jgi:hypothetical protein
VYGELLPFGLAQKGATLRQQKAQFHA